MKTVRVAPVLLCIVACGKNKPQPPVPTPDAGPHTVVWFRLDGGAYFSRPFPTDLDRDDAGQVRFDSIPNPIHNSLVQSYVDLVAGRFDGFTTTGATYFRFGEDIDLDGGGLPASLADSMTASSAIQLIDIDPNSEERGRHFPLQWRFQSASSTYWPDHTLAIAPATGFPLRAHTRYAVVVTDSLLDAQGQHVGPDADLSVMLDANANATPVQAQARTWISPSVDELAHDGIDRSHIAGLAVFTTQDPVTETYEELDALANFGQPSLLDMVQDGGGTGYVVYRGHFGPVPTFQLGTSPYSDLGSGDILFDGGAPIQQGSMNLAFVLAVPTTPVPDGGFPVAIYAHGTGGSASSFVNDGTAASLTAQGLATVSFDQPFHGERSENPGVLGAGVQFFNFLNPVALRRNVQVAAMNMSSVIMLMSRLQIPASVSPSGQSFGFDVSRLVSFTHSQGSMGGALWLAGSPQAHAAVLSGAGGTPIYAIIQQTPQLDVLFFLAGELQVDESDTTDLNPLTPIFTLMREFSDPASPVNYASAYVTHPRAGMPPRNVFITMGLGDTYITDDEIAGLVVSAQLPQLEPVLLPYATYDLLGIPVEAMPVQGNLASGSVTSAWQQATPPQGHDGHFVVFDDPDLKLRVARFLGEAAYSSAPPTLSQ